MTYLSKIKIEIIAVTLLVVCMILICGNSLFSYHLINDDYSMIYYSNTATVIDMFRKGFSEYFIVYPEWTSPKTSFIRPLANVYANVVTGLVDTKYIASAFLVVQCSVLAMAVYFIKKNMTTSTPLIFLIVFAPVFVDDYAYFNLAFHHEAICALFGLGALICYFNNRVYLCALLLLLSTFTKETGLFLSLGIVAIEILQKTRNWKVISIYSIPAVIWGLVRISSDISVTESYALPLVGYDSPVWINLFRGFLFNPLNYDYGGFSQLKGFIEGNNQNDYSILGLALIQAATVLAFYFVLFAEGYKIVRERSFGESSSKLYMLFAILTGIYVIFGLSARFGYFLVILLPVFLLSEKYSFRRFRFSLFITVSIMWIVSIPYRDSNLEVPVRVSSSFNQDVKSNFSHDKRIGWISYRAASNPTAIGGLLRGEDARVSFLFHYIYLADCGNLLKEEDRYEGISYALNKNRELSLTLPSCVEFSFPLANKLGTVKDIETEFVFDSSGIKYRFVNCFNKYTYSCRTLIIKNSLYDEIRIIQPSGNVEVINSLSSS
ncbi:hypothetical protein JYU12_02115 [bacterium AH-315-K03]|nr:hypothetical protein [bacterium AH-315-K03]